MYYKSLIFLILILSTALFPQGNYIDHSETTGELSETDLFNTEMGNYDGYTLPLNKDEFVDVILYSESMVPDLLLVSPSGKTYPVENKNGIGLLSFRKQIDEGGDWIVYVFSHRGGRGSYFLSTSFAGPTALNFPKSSSICEQIDFLAMHSRARFIFLETDNPENSPSISSSLGHEINSEENYYKALLFKSDSLNSATHAFSEIEKVIKCNGWSKQGSVKTGIILFSKLSDGFKQNFKLELNTNVLNGDTHYVVELIISGKFE